MTRQSISFLAAAFCCFVAMESVSLADETDSDRDDHFVSQTAEDQESPESPEEAPKIKLADVRKVPFYSLAVDIDAMLKLRAELLPHLKEADYDKLMVTSIPEDIFGPSVGKDPRVFQTTAYITRPNVLYYGDVMTPVFDEMLTAITEGDGVKDLGDGVYSAEGTVAVIENNHAAFMQGENIQHNADDIARLRKLLRQTLASPPRNAGVISAAPRAISRSILKPELTAFRTRLFTEAQRRDDDVELDYLARSMWQKLKVAMFDAFFRDTESIQYSIDFDEKEKSMLLELNIKTVKGTELDQYIARIGQTRNRCLKFLHPDQIGFVCASIPLSDDLAQPLPKVVCLLADAVCSGEGGPGDVAAKFEQTLQPIADERTLEVLFQAVAVTQESTACILIVPLAGVNSLEASLIEVLAATSSGEPRAIGEVAGWPVYGFLNPSKEIYKSFADDLQSFWVATDECAAWMIGREEDLPLLESILKHEFEADPMARRFSHNVFAAATTLEPLQSIDRLLLDDVIQDMPVKNDENEAGPGKMELSLQTAAQQLTLTATFDQDALLAGASLLENSVHTFGTWCFNVAFAQTVDVD